MVTLTNMSIADKLAEKLRTSELGELLDESDIATISKEAIHKVFFEPRTTGSGYNQKTEPPLAVELAKEIVTPIIKEHLTDIAKEFAAMPEFREAMLTGALAVLPEMMVQGMRYTISQASAAAASASAMNACIAIRNNVMPALINRGEVDDMVDGQHRYEDTKNA